MMSDLIAHAASFTPKIHAAEADVAKAVELVEKLTADIQRAEGEISAGLKQEQAAAAKRLLAEAEAELEAERIAAAKSVLARAGMSA